MLRRPNHCPRSTILRTWLLLFSLHLVMLIGCATCRFSDDCDDCRTHYHLDHKAPTMRTFAKAVTHLEEDIQRYGSIVIKQPDIYGETNLMAYIQEYEQIMKKRKDGFEDTIQAFIARSDAADLQSITALGSGQFTTTTGSGATASTTRTVVAPFQLSGSTTVVPATVLDPLNPTSATSTLNAPAASDFTGAFDMMRKLIADGLKTKSTSGVAIEPTQSLRQNSNYIKVNQGLRRLNTGDDNSQSAGNALYLLRIPVSVLPGRKTHRGYAAKVTMQAKLVVDENHLSDTFPRLVIGELATVLQKELCEKWHDLNSPVLVVHNTGTQLKPFANLTKVNSGTMGGIIKSTNSLLLDKIGSKGLAALKKLYEDSLSNQKLSELNARNQAINALESPKEQELRDFLFNVFATSHEECIMQNHYQTLLNNSCKPSDIGALTADSECLCGIEIKGKVALRALLIQTILFNKELNKIVMRSNHGLDTNLPFYYPHGDSRVTGIWAELIQREFPVHVFNLDPIVEEQNVFDAFSRRREIQLAFAFAVANGKMRADQALKYSRLMAFDQSTIALNRTVVAFAHDHDTFGYVFKPRVQSPPEEKSNIEAIARTLWATGPTREYDLRHRELEPGIRDCEVLIVMPSFVPKMRLDVTTNWERLEKPGTEKIEYEDMIDLGAKLQEVKKFAASITDHQCFRDGDYERLINRVDQLEKMLPLQTQYVKVPFEYDLPGGDIFDTGTKHLRPTATGYYGLNFVSKNESAEVFITGTNFHPTQTHIIMAGKESHLPSGTFEVEVLSRQLLKVTIQPISPNLTNNPAELRVATPAGVSNGLEIRFKEDPVASKGLSFDNFKSLNMEYNLESVADQADRPKNRFKYVEASQANLKNGLVIKTGDVKLDDIKPDVLVQLVFLTPTGNNAKIDVNGKYDATRKVIEITATDAKALALALLKSRFPTGYSIGETTDKYPDANLSFSSASVTVKVTSNTNVERTLPCEKLDVFLRRTAP